MENREKWVPAMHGLVRDTPWPSPDIPGWVGLYPFKAWCLQTLPTIFDESMSYYELLCKLLHYIEGCLQDVQLLGEEFVKLKQFVENYFDSLDIQQEVNNKLDQMATDGKLNNIFRQFLLPYWGMTSWGNCLCVCLGGDFVVNSKRADNVTLDYATCESIGFFKNQRNYSLAKAGSHLMGSGENTFYAIFKKWATNLGVLPYTLGYRNVFVWLEDSDMSYSISQIQTQLHEISTDSSGAWLNFWLMPRPLSNVNETRTNSAVYYALQNIKGSGFRPVNIRVTTPNEFPQGNYYTSDGYLTPNGIYAYVTKIYNEFNVMCYKPEFSYTRLNLTSKSYIDMQYVEATYNTILVKFKCSIYVTDKSIYTQEIPKYLDDFFLFIHSSSAGGGITILNNSGTVTIDTNNITTNMNESVIYPVSVYGYNP